LVNFQPSPVRLGAVVVHGVAQVRAAIAQAAELCDGGTADRGVARKLDRARVRGLHHGVPQTRSRAIPARISSRPTSSTLPSGIRHAPSWVNSDAKRSQSHHRRVGELAAQRLDLEAISDGLRVAYRFPPLSVLLSGPGQVR
jgi:hypothetical protein